MRPPPGPGSTLTVVLLILSTACRAAPSSAQEAGSPAGRREPRESLFISPAGQPFRAGPGEPYPVGRWFAQVDRNGDGRIDRAEFLADAEAFFHVLDTNHDGVIDGFEISAYEHVVVPEILGAYRASVEGERGEAGAHHGRLRGEGSGVDDHRRERGGDARDGDGAADEVMGGAAPYELLNLPEPVASADINLTGRVSLSDFLAAANRRFGQLDIKARGYLTLSDLPKTPVQRAAEGKKPGRRGS